MRLGLLGRILAAQSLSSLGTSVSTIALAYMVLKLTGSVLQMGGVMAISTFPLVVTSFVGGAILDRYRPRSVMVLADLCRAVLIFAMPFLAAQSEAFIYVVAGFMGIFSALFNPGQIKLIGELAERESLVRANSFLSVSQTGAEMLGYLAGAALVTSLGYAITFSVDAASYVLSAALLIGLPKGIPPERKVSRVTTLLSETPQVVATIWRQPALRTNLLLATLAAMAVMMSVPNSQSLAFNALGGWGVTALEIFTAAGMIVGGLLVSRLSLSGDKNTYVAFGLVAMGACFVGVSFTGFFWLALALIGLAGMANVTTFVPSMTLFQEAPDEAHKGRLIAIRYGFGQMGTTGGFMIGGVLGSLVGIRLAFLVAGLLGIGLTALIYLPHRVAAGRRGQAAWSAAIAGGACRRDARALANLAMLGGEACEELQLQAVPVAAGGVGYVRSGAPVAGAASAELTLASAGPEEEA